MTLAVRVPASSANLGAGFDVFGMALDLYADLGTGDPPDDARAIDEHHPSRVAVERLGGSGDIWLRTNIPMARGLGFSGAVRVGAAALGLLQAGGSLDSGAAEMLAVTTELEGHGDNVAASICGGVSAFVQGAAVPFRLGPVMSDATFVAWIPEVTTSTDKSRQTLPEMVRREDAVHNIGRATQFALAFAHDDPTLLSGATDDRLHQADRLPSVPGAGAAIAAGVGAGAWCGWLSGSGPTVGLFTHRDRAADVLDAIVDVVPAGGHTKLLSIDAIGCRQI